MRISRLYLPAPLPAGEPFTLDQDSAHYLRTVLRLKKGAELIVFDGDGGECMAIVREAHREGVVLDLGPRSMRDVESPLRTHLGLGISRGERMDLAIQKAVELGVGAITPLITERCVVQLDEDRKEHRLRHWQRIAQSACEQCGRNRLPELHAPERLQDWIARQQGLRLFLHPEGGQCLRELPAPTGAVCLLSGPEGGFSDSECRLAKDTGFTPLRLGPRILRTETAAVAALAAIQTLWGDFGL